MSKEEEKAEEPEGYMAIGIALPVRTQKAATNQKRWETFASAVEDALNELREDGCQSVSYVAFEGHGVLISGFRPSTADRQDLGVSVIPLPGGIEEMAKTVSLNRVLQRVEEGLAGSDKPKEEALKDLVDSIFGSRAPAEALRSFIDFAKEHSSKCSEGRCGTLLPQLIQALEAKLNTQLC